MSVSYCHVCIYTIFSTPVGRKHEHLQETVDQLQQELFRLESQKDDYKIKADLLERELQDVLQKVSSPL